MRWQLVTGMRVQFNGKAPAGHAQALDLHFHRRSQLAGRLLAQPAQLLGFFLVVARIGG